MLYLVALTLGLLVAYGLFRWEWQSRPAAVSPLSLSELKQAHSQQLGSRADAQGLADQLTSLLQRGWSAQTLARVYLSGQPAGRRRGCRVSQLDFPQRFVAASTVGSPLFQAMWAAEPVGSPDLARRCLRILLKTLAFPAQLTGTREQTEDLLVSLADLSPADPFWSELAAVVDRAFPGHQLSQKNDLLAQQVHQLRYVISLQQSQWVSKQTSSPGQSDREALLFFLKNLDHRRVAVTESSRLHNKGPVRERPNYKVLLDFHSEFILDGEEGLLDVLSTDVAGRLNGASFNYASRRGTRHWELDVAPVRAHDPAWRLALLRANPSPKLGKTQQGYASAQGQYSLDKVSLAQRVKQAQKRFDCDLKQLRKV